MVTGEQYFIYVSFLRGFGQCDMAVQMADIALAELVSPADDYYIELIQEYKAEAVGNCAIQAEIETILNQS